MILCDLLMSLLRFDAEGLKCAEVVVTVRANGVLKKLHELAAAAAERKAQSAKAKAESSGDVLKPKSTSDVAGSVGAAAEAEAVKGPAPKMASAEAAMAAKFGAAKSLSQQMEEIPPPVAGAPEMDRADKVR